MKQKLKVLDLFSGVGGFSLGLERTGGFETVAFCEIEPFCRRVLAKHWPGIPIYEDVRELTGERLAADGIGVDVICGGFPCQDISLAGNGEGLWGRRSGLWSDYARLIGDIQPRFVLVENVAALLGRGLGDVLGDLAAIGYDTEWHCIPASAVGAPHRRDRVWIVAYPGGKQHEGRGIAVSRALAAQLSSSYVAHADRRRWPTRDGDIQAAGYRHSTSAGGGNELCDTNRERLALGQSICRNDVEKFAPTIGADWWATEPDVGRVAHGIPARVDRLRGLGNAVVPQIPELIGKAILESIRD